MARQRTTANRSELMRFDGMDQVIDKLEGLIAFSKAGAVGPELKKVYVKAAAVHSDQVRANIAAINVSPRLKEALTATVVTNAGSEDKSNAISQMSQRAGTRILGRDVPNPYWFEFGTVPRAARVANRGLIHPTPVFRPAIQQSRERVTEVLIDGLRKLILP